MINTRNFMHKVEMDNFQDITRTNMAELTAATGDRVQLAG